MKTDVVPSLQKQQDVPKSNELKYEVNVILVNKLYFIYLANVIEQLITIQCF